MPPKKIPSALTPNPRVSYIKQHKKDFEFPGVRLVEGVSSKVIEGAIPARPYIVFEIPVGQLTLKVGNNKLVSRKHHVTAFNHYDDARPVTSAYHYTAIGENDEELRVYVDENFNLLDVVAKQGASFIAFSPAIEGRHEKEAIYQACYKFVENIFKKIQGISDEARARIDEQLAELNKVSYSLNENPVEYRDALQYFLDELEKVKEILPVWYYQFHSETKQNFLKHMKASIEQRKKSSKISVTSVSSEKKVPQLFSAPLKVSASNQQTIAPEIMRREQLQMLQEDFLSCEAQTNAGPVLRRVQLMQRQWDNLCQQIAYQFDISLSDVAVSLEKRRDIEKSLSELVLQKFNEFHADELSELLTSLSSILPVSQWIFSLVHIAILNNKPGVISRIIDLKWIQKETLDIHCFDDKDVSFACNALRLAFEKRSLNVFQELLGIGVNPDSMTLKNTVYFRCIEAACAAGEVEFLRVLLAHNSGDGVILPGVTGQFPMITDPNFDSQEYASHFPMMIAASYERVECIQMLAEKAQKQWLAVGCALHLCNENLVQRLTHFENGPRTFGKFSLEMFWSKGTTVVDAWNIDMYAVEFLPLLCIELMKRDKMEGERRCMNVQYSSYALLLLAHPALSKVNIHLLMVSETNRVEEFLSQEKSGGTSEVSVRASYADFSPEEVDFITSPLVRHLVNGFLRLVPDNDKNENKILTGQISSVEYGEFDKETFMHRIIQCYASSQVSPAAFMFRQFLKKLVSPTTCLRDLAISMYAIIFYNQYMSYGGMDPNPREPLYCPRVIVLLSTLIQLKLILLLSQGKSATLLGSGLRSISEWNMLEICQRLQEPGDLGFLSILDEAISLADTREVKVGMLQLKLSMESIFKDDFYLDQKKFNSNLSSIGEAELDPALKAVCKSERENQKGYWTWERLQMNFYCKAVQKIENARSFANAQQQLVAGSSSMYPSARGNQSAGKGGGYPPVPFGC